MDEPRTKPDYTYQAIIQEPSDIYDGDTFTVDLRLGFNVVLRHQKLRLYGIDTPEVRGDEKVEGKKVRDWVRHELGRHIKFAKPIIIQSYRDKSGKYGRWLATVWYQPECYPGEGWRNLNTFLVAEGYAKAVDY